MQILSLYILSLIKTICVHHHFCWLVAVDIPLIAFFCFRLPQLKRIQLFHYFLLLQPVPKRPKLIQLLEINILVSKQWWIIGRIFTTLSLFFLVESSSFCLLYDVFKLNWPLQDIMLFKLIVRVTVVWFMLCFICTV